MSTYPTKKQPPAKASFASLSDILKSRIPGEKNKYVSREFQDYGYRLACELDDEKRASLYIKLAKTVDRGILEQARTFVLDANARSKSRLFMWKVKEIKEKLKQKEEKKHKESA